jgi:hypothetical protein
VCVLLRLGPGASDLHNTYLAINENLTDDEVDELIRLCDHDGDGQVRLGMGSCQRTATALPFALQKYTHERRAHTRTDGDVEAVTSLSDAWLWCDRCRMKSFEKWCWISTRKQQDVNWSGTVRLIQHHFSN